MNGYSNIPVLDPRKETYIILRTLIIYRVLDAQFYEENDRKAICMDKST